MYKKTIIIGTVLILAGCKKELSIKEINKLHTKFFMTEKQVYKLAQAGCSSQIIGSSGQGILLGHRTNKIINVNILGKIERTYTNNPLGSNDLLAGVGNMLKGEPTPIYTGKCEVQPYTKLTNVRTKISHENRGNWTTYYFVINPKSCLSENKIDQSMCFSLDFNPISIGKFFGRMLLNPTGKSMKEKNIKN